MQCVYNPQQTLWNTHGIIYIVLQTTKRIPDYRSFFGPNNKNNNVYFKKLLSEIRWQYCVMLIVAQLHRDFLPRWWITASCTTRPHRHSHGYAISLIQLISKSTIYYPSSPRLWWGMEKQKGIRLPGNWKGARAARDVRLLWFIRRAHTQPDEDSMCAFSTLGERVGPTGCSRMEGGDRLTDTCRWMRTQRGTGLWFGPRSGACLYLIIMEATGRRRLSEALCVKKKKKPELAMLH